MHGTELLLDVWGRWARLDGLGLGYKSPMAVAMGLKGDGDQAPTFDDEYMEQVGQVVCGLRHDCYAAYELINARFRQRMSERELTVYFKVTRHQVRQDLASAVQLVDRRLQSLDQAA